MTLSPPSLHSDKAFPIVRSLVMVILWQLKLNPHRSFHASPEAETMLNKEYAYAHTPNELPAVADWQDFASWCRQEGCQGLSASDETLMRYAEAKAERDQASFGDSQRLGWFALAISVAALILPILAYVVVSALTMDPELSEKGALLLFSGLQLVALSCAWLSRETIEGRTAWRTACLASIVALLATYAIRDASALQVVKSLVSN